ncbi:hypothetical protein J6590_102888 [Homalodisca vitripennis]|nr:hypothetical protein J6590_102888 [Homalodisca vitripennis]
MRTAMKTKLVPTERDIYLQQFNGIRKDRGVLLDLVFSSLEYVEVTQALGPLVTVEPHHPSMTLKLIA